MKNKPLGSLIFEQVRNLQREIETELEKISVNSEEWAIDVDYNFSFSEDKKIRDYFLVTVIPYVSDKKQSTFSFRFKSIEAISLEEICRVMYEITLNPDQSEQIVEESKVNIVYYNK